MSFTYRDIVWVTIIAIVVLTLSKCHRDKNDTLDAGVKALQAKIVKDSNEYSKRIIALENTATEIDSKANAYVTRNKIIEQQLDDKSAIILKLSKAIKGSKIDVDTSGLTTVGPEYIDYCDSLADVSTALVVGLNTYKINSNKAIAAKDTIIKVKDAIITTERKAKQECKNDYNALMHFYQDYQKATKPHNQVYVGAELIGSPSYLVSNAGLALTLKTKTNKLWQVSGGIQTNGQYYARINGNILIKLKR